MTPTKVYSFINSGDAFKWEKNPTGFDNSRIGEYTEDFIQKRFIGDDGKLIDEISKYPVLFSSESPHGVPARVGWIDSIEWESGRPIISYDFDPSFRPISQEELEEIQWELEIEDFEFFRTHWAIKQADLLTILKNRGFRLPGFKSGSNKITDPETVEEAARTKEATTASVFISYSHHDAKYLSRLQTHLAPVKRWTALQIWDDTRIEAGDRWKEQVERELELASVAILLVSADFLASDFITENELPPLLERAEKMGTRIIPMILKPCLFTSHPELSEFQSINGPDNSLISLDENGQERLYTKVAKTVLDMVGK